MQFSFSRLAGAMVAISGLCLVACDKADEPAHKTETTTTTAPASNATSTQATLPTQMLKVSW
ncbi:hypothetical protein [Moraxella boevrei]|uniref:hypothetical protein n=1 Tax=Faucicola boevrei TaxID=346665 RepID=UPI0037355BB0